MNTSDYQMIKVQEIEEDLTASGHCFQRDDNCGQTDAVQSSSSSSCRIPRTFELEAREDLIDVCKTGDKIYVVGTLKTIQVILIIGYD